MKISNLIEALTKLKELHGDQTVYGVRRYSKNKYDETNLAYLSQSIKTFDERGNIKYENGIILA